MESSDRGGQYSDSQGSALAQKMPTLSSWTQLAAAGCRFEVGGDEGVMDPGCGDGAHRVFEDRAVDPSPRSSATIGATRVLLMDRSLRTAIGTALLAVRLAS